MNDAFEWESPSEEAPLPKQLREMYEKEKAKRVEQERQLADLQQRVRKSELSKVFATKGIPEKAVNLFPSDIEPTEEAVETWIGTYGDLFGSTKPEEKSEQQPAPKTEASTQAPQVIPDAFARMSELAATGTPASGAKDYSQAIFNPSFCDEVPFDDFKAWLTSEQQKYRK